MEHSNKFMEITTPELPGVYYKCEGCGTVCTLEDRDQHQCPETPAQEEARWNKEHEEDQWKRRADLWALVLITTDAKEIIRIYDEVKALEENMVITALSRIEKALPEPKYRALILKTMAAELEAVRAYKKRHYDEVDEMRKKGIPYSERMKFFRPALIEFADSHEAKLLRDSRAFSPLPIRDWFGFPELEDAKAKGFAWVIRSNLARVYTAPKN